MSSLLGTIGLGDILTALLPTWGLTDCLKEFLVTGDEMWAERLELYLVSSSLILAAEGMLMLA